MVRLAGVSQTELCSTEREITSSQEDGLLTKENFFKIVQGSDFFLKSFDKNNDGEVTEVRQGPRREGGEVLRVSFLDRHHDQGGAGIWCSGQE